MRDILLIPGFLRHRITTAGGQRNIGQNIAKILFRS